MRTEVIAVGTELLLGQIANTNAQWISQRMAELGLPVYSHAVVGDNLDRVAGSFREAARRSDIIIVTGGLGPTEDDLTRDAGSMILGKPVHEHAPSMERIEAYYKKNNKTMSLNNRKQSHVFDGAFVLDNKEGMAPGQIIQQGEVTWVFLPGVPREMKALMESGVIPFLQRSFSLQSEIVSEMLHFIGIGESDLETQLQALISHQTNPTLAPLASEGEVGLRLTATGETTDEAKAKIAEMKRVVLDKVGDFYYGSDDETIESTVQRLLSRHGYRLGAAESFTGGKFIERMISLPGASAVCQGGLTTYTAEMKEQVLDIPKYLIREYGTISHECAEMMALNTQSLLHVDAAVSFTGVAGPDSSEGKEPGTVFIGLQIRDKSPEVHRFQFQGGRDQVRERAVKKGFELLFHHLKD
ncbi:competence/damage-inducible protein A [Halobacillus kuroshimensis]|uniref:Putative competence-damage inducible protein n=1 Tax=Halobacillus kuroshimensis TaxID=302481 RepID=A0ABS3DTB2_9BACI|nr:MULTISPECIES: competence/damage-inducible protein A [Halobacillus]MBN8234519.1 competence/damage-inducible protein A [Halobacillus kuroshimensis]